MLANTILAVLLTVTTQQGPRVLLDRYEIIAPGAYASACVVAPAGRLRIHASSEDGRTGEDAFFTLDTSSKQDDVFLNARLTPDGLTSTSRIVGGSYCYVVTVTNRLDHSGDEPSVRPYKAVRVTLTYGPPHGPM